MAKKKPSLPIERSPKGVLSYVFIEKPDTKFDAEGVYKASLTAAAAKCGDFTAKIDAAIAAKMEAERERLSKGDGKAKAKVKNLKSRSPYEPEFDKDGEETGRLVFKTKVAATGKNKETGDTWSNKPALFDAKGKPTKVAVYSGSEGYVAVQIVPYFNEKDVEVGATLRLKAVQVTKLVSGGGSKGADGYGFEAEDGYEADEDEGYTPPADEDEDDAADEADEDTGDEPVDF